MLFVLKGMISDYVSINEIICTFFFRFMRVKDRLCGLVVGVLDCRSRGPGFDSRALTKKKSNGSGTESTQPREYN
jgi:hypothetical protein